MSEFMSYAQNREDVYINWLLRGKQSGIYVDVGANHPEVDSVTRYFYLKGWRGINIEPIERLYRLLQQDRPRDITVQLGISERKGSLTFTEYEGADGLSTLSEAYQAQNKQLNQQAKRYKIKVVPLRDVLAEHLGKDDVIDFLKVDVEGYEYEVLASNDWTAYRPRLVVVEANHVNHDWRPILNDAGYKKVFFDGVNEYYAPDGFDIARAMAEYPDYVIGPMILDVKQREHAEWVKEQGRHEAQAVVDRYRSLAAASQAEAGDLRRQIDELRNLRLLSHLKLWAIMIHVKIRRKLIWLQTPHPDNTGALPSSEPQPLRTVDINTLTELKQQDVAAFVPIIESAQSAADWRKQVFGGLLAVYDFAVRSVKYVIRSVRKATR